MGDLPLKKSALKDDNKVLTLGDAIRFLRSNKNLSSRALSSISGLSPSYIGKVEAGEIKPSFDAFCAIAFALNVSDTEILFLVRQNQKVLNEDQRKYPPNV